MLGYGLVHGVNSRTRPSFMAHWRMVTPATINSITGHCFVSNAGLYTGDIKAPSPSDKRPHPGAIYRDGSPTAVNLPSFLVSFLNWLSLRYRNRPFPRDIKSSTSCISGTLKMTNARQQEAPAILCKPSPPSQLRRMRGRGGGGDVFEIFCRSQKQLPWPAFEGSEHPTSDYLSPRYYISDSLILYYAGQRVDRWNIKILQGSKMRSYFHSRSLPLSPRETVLL